MPKPDASNQRTVTAYDDLIKKLVANGWESTGDRGESWWSQRFRRKVTGEESAAQRRPNEQRLPLVPGVELSLLRVPAGKFLYSENKLTVHLDDYWIGKYPVTNAQFRAFLQASRYKYDGKLPGDQDDHPVIKVSWHDATAFCAWAARVSGQPIHLPSEVQWEKAACGTDGRTYPWGEQEPNRNLCNFDNIFNGTTPVGQFSPQGDSPTGCVDMAGNAWDWCADWYDDLPEKIAANPKGPGSGKFRVLRGGSWNNESGYVRSSYRLRYNPDYRVIDFGFRCSR